MIAHAAPDLSGRELEYVTDAVRSGWVSSQGPYLRRFEEDFSHYIGAPAMTCSSGTAALHLALLAAGIGPGDEVIVPDLTFAATAAVVVRVGARPVLVDVNEWDWTLSLPNMAEAITPDTRAVIPVHLYGLAANMPAVMTLAARHGLVVIEDCAEALGVGIGGRRLGGFGDYGCFSFFANKHMTTGEGGALVSRVPGNVDLARRYRDHGTLRPYVHLLAGLNYRMTNLQAALGCAQLERIEELLAARARVVARYEARLKGRGAWVFVAECGDPEKSAARLAKAGIETRPVFTPLHLQLPYRRMGAFPNATAAHANHIVLPTGPHMSEEMVDFVCSQL